MASIVGIEAPAVALRLNARGILPIGRENADISLDEMERLANNWERKGGIPTAERLIKAIRRRQAATEQ